MKLNQKFYFAVLLILVISFSGCFKEEGIKDVSNGVKISRNGNLVVVSSSEAGVGQEVTINSEIKESDIEFVAGKNGMVIENSGKTKIVIAKHGEEISANEELFKIKNINTPIEVTLTDCASEGDIKSLKAIKKGVVASPVLLGDYNGDGVVSLVDLSTFKTSYGTKSGDADYSSKYDIAPALKDSAADSAESWVDIYTTANPDNKIGIADFVVFASNFDKKPTFTINYDLWALIKGSNTTVDAVTQNLTLVAQNTSTGDVISWSSSDTAVVSATGTVTRATSDKTVTLTANVVRRNILKATKTIQVTVKADVIIIDYQVEVDAAKAALSDAVIKGTNTDLLNVTSNLVLGTTAANSVSVAWVSSDVAALSNTGVVTQGTADKTVTLTATLTKNTASATKVFNVTVKAKTQTVEGITVYIDATYANQLYAWTDAPKVEPLGAYPGTKLTLKDREFLYYTFDKAITKINFLVMKDGAKITTVDQSATANIWYDSTGKTTAVYPYGPQAPSITINPNGGYFTATQVVQITATAAKDTTLATSKYTIDGTDPKTNGTAFTATVSVTIGADMADNDTKTIKVWSSSTATTGETLESTATTSFTKGTPKKSPLRLGAIYSAASTKFAIWSPDATNVSVNVAGTDYPCSKEPDSDGYTNVYSATVQGDLHLKEYKFKINGNGIKDPSGFMINYANGNNVVINMAATDPDGGWVPRPEFKEREDAVIYEVHVRDFTMYNSGLDASKKGKFLGMVQTGTTVNGVKTGIDHLKELGVTHVQILPFFDFNSTGYNWGYNPMNYNIPEENYCSDPSDYIKRIKEVKTMINEFHKNGIRVVMDVVYNHTDSAAGLPAKYYFSDQRLDMSGCGSSVNAGEPMVSKFIQESLNMWVSEYKMDGYRFDLIGIFPYPEVNKWAESIHTNNPGQNIMFYGEPWDGYYEGRGLPDAERSTRVRYGNMPAMAAQHVGVFNDKIRDGIRGNGDHIGATYQGYMHGKTGGEGNISIGMRGSLTDNYTTSPLGSLWSFPYTADPEQTINYAAAHDNLCLWDKIRMEGFTENNKGKEIAKMAHAIVMTAQGIPFIHAGDEILRTKGNDVEVAKNSYNASDEVNKIDWNWKVQYADVFDFNKKIIAMRRAHPGFRMTTWNLVKANVTTEVKGQVIITRINGAAVGDDWKNIIVVANSGSTYSLPLTGMWNVFAEKGNANDNTTASGSISCEGPNITILYQK